MLDGPGVLKFADFGLSRVEGENLDEVFEQFTDAGWFCVNFFQQYIHDFYHHSALKGVFSAVRCVVSQASSGKTRASDPARVMYQRNTKQLV